MNIREIKVKKNEESIERVDLNDSLVRISYLIINIYDFRTNLSANYIPTWLKPSKSSNKAYETL